TVTRYKHQQFSSRADAEAAARAWEAEGYENTSVNDWSGRVYAMAWKREPRVVVPGNTAMPRPPQKDWNKNQALNDWFRQRLERRPRSVARRADARPISRSRVGGRPGGRVRRAARGQLPGRPPMGDRDAPQAPRGLAGGTAGGDAAQASRPRRPGAVGPRLRT